MSEKCSYCKGHGEVAPHILDDQPCPVCKGAKVVEGATGAREFRKAWSHKPTPIPAHDATNELWYSESCAEQLMDAYASSQLKKLDGVAEEAAEKIYYEVWGTRREPEHKEAMTKQFTAIISKVIAERLK